MKDKEKQREYEKTRRSTKKRQEYLKNWRKENKDHIAEYANEWYEENRDRIIKQKKEDNKKRYHTDPAWKLRKLASSAIYSALKDGKSGQSFLDYVDWTIEELKEHLESQFEDWMNWDNHGEWHIDHIKPQSVLLEGVTSMDDPKFRECWALENLRPLEAKENRKKGNKLLDE